MVLKSFWRAAASTNIFFFLLGFLQRKVDEIARLSETRRKEQERNFRLVSLERGSSHRGTVVGALACHLVRVLVGTLYVGWVCFGFSPFQPDKQGLERKGEGNSRARVKAGEVPSPRTHFALLARPKTLLPSLRKASHVGYFLLKEVFLWYSRFCSSRNQHCQILIQVSQVSWGHFKGNLHFNKKITLNHRE